MEVSREILAEVAREIFENLVFISLQPPDEEADSHRVHVKATIRFAGPICGSVALGVSETLLPELALNMLGLEVEPEDSARTGRDALGEVTNILCGNLLARLVGPEPVFDLGVPKLESVSEAEAKLSEVSGRTAVRLEMEGGRVELSIGFDGPDEVTRR